MIESRSSKKRISRDGGKSMRRVTWRDHTYIDDIIMSISA